jgi:hypothetical protein
MRSRDARGEVRRWRSGRTPRRGFRRRSSSSGSGGRARRRSRMFWSAAALRAGRCTFTFPLVGRSSWSKRPRRMPPPGGLHRRDRRAGRVAGRVRHDVAQRCARRHDRKRILPRLRDSSAGRGDDGGAGGTAETSRRAFAEMTTGWLSTSSASAWNGLRPANWRERCWLPWRARWSRRGRYAALRRSTRRARSWLASRQLCSGAAAALGLSAYQCGYRCINYVCRYT